MRGAVEERLCASVMEDGWTSSMPQFVTGSARAAISRRAFRNGHEIEHFAAAQRVQTEVHKA